jgi:hypothetical protein
MDRAALYNNIMSQQEGHEVTYSLGEESGFTVCFREGEYSNSYELCCIPQYGGTPRPYGTYEYVDDLLGAIDVICGWT